MPPMTPASKLESRHRSRSSGSSAAKVAKPSIDRMWAARMKMGTDPTRIRGRSPNSVSCASLELGLRPRIPLSPFFLSILEDGLSLLEKRGHAFLLVLERELRVEHAALEQHALGERRLVGAVDRFLDHHHDRQRVAGDFLGHRHRLLHQLVERHDARDQAGALRLLRVHHARGQAQVHRLRLAGEARQPLRAAEARHDAEVDLGLAEPGVVRGDDDVALHGQLVAAAERVAGDRRDHRLAQLPPVLPGGGVIAQEAGVLTITLNRPEKLNAFNPEMHSLLRQAIERAADEADIRAVLLTGSGRGFCAGQDLAERDVSPGAAPIDLSVSIGSYYNPLVRRLRELPKPVVCAVNGVAAGAGANVALACDLVLAARSASFVQSFARLGLVPDSGGTYFLPRLVGTARAMGLALLGEKLSAEDAERWGLIWKAVDDDKLPAEANALARALASGPTNGYGLMKRPIQASAGNSLEAQLDLERDLQRDAGFSADYREGVSP